VSGLQFAFQLGKRGRLLLFAAHGRGCRPQRGETGEAPEEIIVVIRRAILTRVDTRKSS
jgi:hypothetical protein